MLGPFQAEAPNVSPNALRRRLRRKAAVVVSATLLVGALQLVSVAGAVPVLAGHYCGGWPRQWVAVWSGHGTTTGTAFSFYTPTQYSVPYMTDDESFENLFIIAYQAQSSPAQSVETGIRTGSTPAGWTSYLIPYGELDSGTDGYEIGISYSIPKNTSAWAGARSAYDGYHAFVQVSWGTSGNWTFDYGSYSVSNGLNGQRANLAQGEVYDDPNLSTAAWMGQGGNSPNGEQFTAQYQPASPPGGYNPHLYNNWGEFTATCIDLPYWFYSVNGTSTYRNGGWPATPPGP
jgi:hypothetical protein